jgi:hypothetical protein
MIVSECADDCSDAVAIGSPVLVSDQNCDDSKEEQLVAAMEKQVTKPKEGEMPHYRYVCYLLFFFSLLRGFLNCVLR